MRTPFLHNFERRHHLERCSTGTPWDAKLPLALGLPVMFQKAETVAQRSGDKAPAQTLPVVGWGSSSVERMMLNMRHLSVPFCASTSITAFIASDFFTVLLQGFL